MMDDKLKGIGSPTAQGGIGPKYEDCVAAWCMCRVISKEELNQIQGVPVEIAVQAEHHFRKLDDVVVSVVVNAQRRDVFIQSKLTLAFTAGDREYAETIRAIADRIGSGAPEEERYVLAFQNNDNNNHRRVSALFSFADYAPDPNEWLARLGSSGPTFEALKTIRTILTVHGQAPDDAIVFRVCKQTRLWQLDLMSPAAADVEYAILSIRDHVRGGAENRRLFWHGLVGVVSQIAGARGSRTRQELVNMPGISGLFREPAVADPVANLMGTEWIADRTRKAEELSRRVQAGQAYESLVEIESLLADVERYVALRNVDTPASQGLHPLLCELKLAQGRAFHFMNFEAETPEWIRTAKDLQPTDALWMQIGRLAATIKDRATLEEACERVRDVASAMLLKIRLAFLEGDESEAWRLVESVPPAAEREAYGLRASRLFENLNDDPKRLAEAIVWAGRFREASADKNLATLLYASAIYMAMVPQASPLYTEGARLEGTELGTASEETLKDLHAFLHGEAGVFEKTIAFGLIQPILAAFRDPRVPYVSVLDDFPAFLRRSTVFRTLGYAKAMWPVGKVELVGRALRQKLGSDLDTEFADDLRSMLESVEGRSTDADVKLSDYPWYYRGKLYSLVQTKEWDAVGPLADSLFKAAQQISVGLEAKFLQALVSRDDAVAVIAGELVELYPFAIETLNGLVDQIDEFLKARRGESDQSIQEFLDELKGEPHWRAIYASLFLLCKRLCALIPSVHCLSIWLNWGINFDDSAQVASMVRSARSWRHDAIAALGEAWLAANDGRFGEVEALVAEYGTEYRVQGSIKDFRDRSALQAGSYRTLVDRRLELLADKERLPGTAKYTVHAMILEGMPSLAAETAKLNLDDFPDDRTALRDFIFTAMQLRRLDLAPDALQRFTTLFPDDEYLWTRSLDDGEAITDILPQREDLRQTKYTKVEIPLHLTGRPFAEKWFQQLHRQEGLQARRIGMFGNELQALSSGALVFMDLTALLAASRYRLWEGLQGRRLRTSQAAVTSLISDLRAMRLKFNEDEYRKHAAYDKLLESPSITIYSELPEGVKALLDRLNFTLGEGEVALHAWLDVPFIATLGSRATTTYRLQDLIHTLQNRGKIRPFQRDAWLAKLRATHPDAYRTEPRLIDESIDRILIDDSDLRDISAISIADEFVPHFSEIFLGPTSSLSRALLSSPVFWAKRALDSVTEYVDQVRSAIDRGQLEVIADSGTPDSDNVDFLAQSARLATGCDSFWCDDAVARSLVASESSVETTSTHQLIRMLRAAGQISDLAYRDALTMIGADGHRDIDGNDLLTACVQDVAFNSSSELLRCAHHLGLSLRDDASRNVDEAEMVRHHVAYHVISFVQAVPAERSDLVYEMCRALAAGVGALAGRLFWPRVRIDIRRDLDSEKPGHLLAIENAAAEAGQLDLQMVIEEEAAIRQQTNQPRLVSAPNLQSYMRFLRFGQ